MSEENNNGSEKNVQNELDKLKQEMKELKEMLAAQKASAKREVRRAKAKAKSRVKARAGEPHPPHMPHRPPGPNFGRVIQQYVSGVMDSVATGIEEAVSAIDLEVGKGIKKKYRTSAGTVAEEFLPDFFETAADFMSILSDENRLKLLKNLEKGGKYQKELSEGTGIKGGTFKHHIDKLIDANFVTQEVVRGRYLITMEGREALKLAEFLYLKKFPSHSSSAVNYEEEYEETYEDDFEDESYQVDIDEDTNEEPSEY